MRPHARRIASGSPSVQPAADQIDELAPCLGHDPLDVALDRPLAQAKTRGDLVA
jgi:hypothetical protein